MSCYLRHLRGILDEAGVDVSAGNRKRVDQAIHGLVDVQYKDCPAAWKRLKLLLPDEAGRAEFVGKLKDALRGCDGEHPESGRQGK